MHYPKTFMLPGFFVLFHIRLSSSLPACLASWIHVAHRITEYTQLQDIHVSWLCVLLHIAHPSTFIIPGLLLWPHIAHDHASAQRTRRPCQEGACTARDNKFIFSGSFIASFSPSECRAHTDNPIALSFLVLVVGPYMRENMSTLKPYLCTSMIHIHAKRERCRHVTQFSTT